MVFRACARGFVLAAPFLLCLQSLYMSMFMMGHRRNLNETAELTTNYVNEMERRALGFLSSLQHTPPSMPGSVTETLTGADMTITNHAAAPSTTTETTTGNFAAPEEMSAFERLRAETLGLLEDEPPRGSNNNVSSSNSSFSFSPLNHSRVAVFYNIFIAEDGQERARRILQEQLGQIGCSSVVLNGQVSLYYNTVGRTLNATWMQQTCRESNLDCRHVQHYESGYEDLTLQRLHEFCDAHSDYKVVYIHSKGSYHDWEFEDFSQNTWRYHMTSAVTSDLCVDPPDASCDICGLLALPWPNLHFAGNMFTAKCSYVRKLIPPREFLPRMNQLVAKALFQKVEGTFVSNLLPDAPHHFGIGRFASEHWLGSHPSVGACDVSVHPDIKFWQTPGTKRDSVFKFAMYPRHSVWAPWSYMYKTPINIRTFSDPKLRIREWYLLSGNLYRWFELYGQAPSPTSWVWTWFPDGQAWLEAVLAHGRGAIAALTKEYSGLMAPQIRRGPAGSVIVEDREEQDARRSELERQAAAIMKAADVASTATAS